MRCAADYSEWHTKSLLNSVLSASKPSILPGQVPQAGQRCDIQAWSLHQPTNEQDGWREERKEGWNEEGMRWDGGGERWNRRKEGWNGGGMRWKEGGIE